MFPAGAARPSRRAVWLKRRGRMGGIRCYTGWGSTYLLKKHRMALHGGTWISRRAPGGGASINGSCHVSWRRLCACCRALDVHSSVSRRSGRLRLDELGPISPSSYATVASCITPRSACEHNGIIKTNGWASGASSITARSSRSNAVPYASRIESWFQPRNMRRKSHASSRLHPIASSKSPTALRLSIQPPRPERTSANN